MKKILGIFVDGTRNGVFFKWNSCLGVRGVVHHSRCVNVVQTISP